MKKIKKIITFVLLGILMLLMGCQKEEISYPTFSAPGWNVVDNPNFSVSMTAVVSLPDYLASYAQDDDELAAFVGDECRGIAKKMGYIYYVLISGTTNETSHIHFCYYSARNKYMYHTASDINFKADDRIGMTDEPRALSLEIIKE